MSELVVFTARENFDFLKFSSRVPAKQQEALKADCIMVQETQKLTAQTFGVWALRLVDLRDGGCWENVINPETGFAFFNDGFGAFCKYAFGLSETATSNLTKVAQFIQSYGDNVGALDERYRGYSFSQLVELSSVSPSNRQYFSSDMTVKEMRTAKDYMKNSSSFGEEKDKDGFDLLAKSQAWKDNGRKTPAPKSEVIPGQIELEDISDSVEVDINPTSELANAGERVSTEEEREELLKNILLFEPWRDKQKRLYDKYKGNCSMYEFLLEVKTEYMFKSCSTVKGGDMQANSKGFVISFPGIPEFFVAWEQIASRIVTLINRGEYYTETDEVNQHADLANAGEEEVDIYDMPMQTHSYDNDDYDEADEAYEDMQADMQTIEEDSERSLPPVEEKPVKKYDFSVRDNIRAFLNDYKNWHKREDIITPYTNHCYWYTLPNFDILYAFESNVATQELLQGVRNYETWASYYIFPRSLYKDDEEPRVFEIAKRDLEGYLMAHRDELKRR